jgi:hypothetical protein
LLDKGTVTPVTAGNWLVDDGLLEVDEDRELVYFTGSKDTPLEQHLYVASFAKGADPTNVKRYQFCLLR